MKVVKIVAGALAVLVGILVIAVAIFAWSFDPNDYKGYVTAFVEERTGRTLEIDGDLELSLFPWLAVETGGITVGNAPGFEEDFARVESASASIRVWPLLRRQVEFGTIILEGIELNLGRNERGTGNWEDLLGADESAESAATGEAQTPSIASLDIAGIALRNGRVMWRENGNEVRYIVDNVTLTTGPINDVDPVDVDLRFGLLDVASQSRLEIDAELSAARGENGLGVRGFSADYRLLDSRATARAAGQLRLDELILTDAESIEAGALALTSRLVQPPLGPESLDVSVSWTEASYDLRTQRFDVAGLVTRSDEIEARWQVAGSSLLDAPSLDGSVTLAAASAASGLRLLEISLSEGVDAAAIGRIDATTKFAADLGSGRVTLSELNARLLGMALTGSASIDANRIRASVTVPRFAPDDSLFDIIEPMLPAKVGVREIDALAFKAAVDANLETGAVSVSDLNVEVLGGTVSGNFSVEAASGGQRLRGALKTSRFTGTAIAGVFGGLLGDTVDSRELGNFAIDTRFDVDTAADRAALSAIALDAFGMSATGELTIDKVSTAPVVAGRARVAGFDPRDFLRRFGQPVPQTSDDSVLRRATIDGRFRIDAETGQFDDLVVDLDDSHFTGNFTVANFESPSYRFALTADAIDVDRYLPPPAEEAAEGERKAGDLELAPEPLNSLRLQGEARVGNLKLANLRFSDVSTELQIGGGEARIDSARAKLYGGEFKGGFFVDTNGEQPTMTLNGQAVGLELKPLIEALVGDANFRGTGSFDIDLTGRGPTVTDNLRSAAGTMSFALSNGAIEGFNLGRTLCQAYNLTQKLPGPPAAPNETQYELIQAAATVADGIATSPELLARSAFMDVTGGGRLALAEQRLDYDMRAKLTKSIGLPRCESMDRLIGDSIPFTIRGTLAEADIKPDFGKILQDRVRDEIEDRARERLEDRLKDRLRDLL